MQRDPVLAAKSLPAGSDGYRVPLTLRVEGGLHYAAARSTFDQDVPLSVVLIWCDGTERTDRSYDDGKVVTV